MNAYEEELWQERVAIVMEGEKCSREEAEKIATECIDRIRTLTNS